ncbi:MAG: gamma-glutamyltransferase family protein, partial [Anaerolineaceae bacterium]|nr:gamma-glutamyltransferase family protein [Anaerolineaceae bacterium]
QRSFPIHPSYIGRTDQSTDHQDQGWPTPAPQRSKAADAAVATAAMLNVTEPTSTGLGGDAFALFYRAADRKVFALNGSGRAPHSLSLAKLRREGFQTALPSRHPYTITVPGACAAWCDLVERFGALSIGQVLAPAIQLAQVGFPVAPVTSYYWQRSEPLLEKTPNGKELLVNGHAPGPGAIFRNPTLAATMQKISDNGKAAYYQGAIAEAIARVVQQAGGCLDLADLAQHTSTWEEPISVLYRDLRVWECPPNGQGLAALLALNLLQGFDVASFKAGSADRLHLMIEAMRVAFIDARRYIADPAFAHVPVAQLLSDEYAASRRKLIDPRTANKELLAGMPVASSDTVYLSVVDGAGNACSFINSNYMGFGTGIVPQGCGFSLQNRGHNFSLDARHPNCLEPGKRPYHTIIPAMATHEEDQSLYACFGVMGGFMQPQGHMQVMVALADDGLNPQSALDRPRFCIEPDDINGMISVEQGTAPRAIRALIDKGHTIQVVRGMDRSLFGRGQIILRDARTGVLQAGSDPRADGFAASNL